MTETKICGAKEKTRLIAWMASIYFVCMPLSIIPLPGDISLLKAISILIGGGFIIALFIGENKIKLNVVHFFLFLYVVYSLSSIFILHDENAWTNLRGILETTVIFTLISTRIYNKREKNLILNSWIIVGAISVIFMLTSGVNITGGGERLTLSLAGGNEDPNQFCGYFFLPILISLDRIVKPGTKIRYRIFYIIFILSMIYVVFATGSRGGLIAVVAAIVGFLFFAVRGVGGKIKILTVTILLGAIFATVLFPLLPESIVERMSVESVLEDGGSGRFEIWGVIWEAIFRSEKSVIVGNGIGSTIGFLKEADIGNYVAHNHWLQIMCDQGLIGLILFMFLFIACFFKTFKNNKVVAISILGMLALSMSLTLYAAYKPFWNILMMSAMNYEEEEEND